MFRQELYRKEYHITRITSKKYASFTLPEENLNILVNQWEIVKKKVSVLEERLWEVSSHGKQDGKLRQLLLWLHEAETLLSSYGNQEGRDSRVPTKFLLRQHEVCMGQREK